MLSILCVRLKIKVKVGIPESFKLTGWYPPQKTGSSHLKRSPLLSGRGHQLRSPKGTFSIVLPCIKQSHSVNYLFIQFQIMEHTRYNNWFPCLFSRIIKKSEMEVSIWGQRSDLISTRDRILWLVFLANCTLSGHPVLSIHLAILRGWPLNTGSTVLDLLKMVKI